MDPWEQIYMVLRNLQKRRSEKLSENEEDLITIGHDPEEFRNAIKKKYEDQNNQNPIKQTGE